MTTSRLELDDVALLRALAAIGPSCSRKLKDLVGQFGGVLEASGVEFLQVKSTSNFFDCADVAQYSMTASCSSDNSWLCVNAGVVGDNVRVWISSNPTAKETKVAVRHLLRDHQNDLSSRNADWIVAEADPVGHTDAEISKPLISVLAKDDWQTPLIAFVRDAVADLKETGILEALLALQATQQE